MRFVLFLALVPSVLYADQAPLVTPGCAHPAKLETHKGGTPGDYVFLKVPADEAPISFAQKFAKKYGLTLTGDVFRSGLQGIVVSTLSPADIAALRCDPDVVLVSTAGS